MAVGTFVKAWLNHRDPTLKEKNDSHQLSIAPQLETGASETFPALSLNIDWVDLLEANIAAVSSLVQWTCDDHNTLFNTS